MAEYDLAIDQGATFAFVVEWREDNGTSPPNGPLISTDGYDAHMQIRQKPGGTVYATYTSLGNDPEITLSGGVLTLRIGADKTNELSKQGVYDIELHNQNDPTDVVRLIAGKVKISLQVTDD